MFIELPFNRVREFETFIVDGEMFIKADSLRAWDAHLEYRYFSDEVVKVRA